MTDTLIVTNAIWRACCAKAVIDERIANSRMNAACCWC